MSRLAAITSDSQSHDTVRQRIVDNSNVKYCIHLGSLFCGGGEWIHTFRITGYHDTPEDAAEDLIFGDLDDEMETISRM